MVNNKEKFNNDDTIYLMCECAVHEDDIVTEIINESTVNDSTDDKSKVVTINATLQSFEVENWNGRIYGGALVMDALNNDGMIQNDIKRGQWVGEYGHPLDSSPRRAMILYPPLVSHRILKYWREGNLLKGTVQTAAKGVGPMMADRILQGMQASFSLRSLGSVDLVTRRVKAPLKIITYDSVFRPSHIEAYQDSILSECVSYKSEDLRDILTESVIYKPLTKDEVKIYFESATADIGKYIAEKSANAAIIADMFKLDKVEAVLTENGRVNIRIDKETTANIAVESYIKMQYADVLSSAANIFKKY